MSQQQVTVGKPDLRTADKRAVAVARYLRHSSILKSRDCLLNGERHDFFRVKRAVRALLDPAYERRRKNTPILPEVKTREDAIELVKLLPLNRLAFNVKKFPSEIALARGLKPQSGVPCVVVSPSQDFGDDEYFAWFFNPVPLSSALYTIGAVVCVFALIAFPLWPYKLRRLGWYLSMSVLVFLIGLLGLSVVRLALYIVTYFVAKPGLWIFPNLFEDLGFFESFVPVYAWHGENVLPKRLRKKKRTRTPEEKAEIKKAVEMIKSQAASGQGGQGVAQGPKPGQPQNAPPNAMLQQVVQRALQQASANAEARKQEIMKTQGNLTDEQQKALHQKLMQEEVQKVQRELQAMGAKVQFQAKPNAQ